MSAAESRSGPQPEVPLQEGSPPPPPESVKRVIDTNLLMARAIREGTPPKATGAEVEPASNSVQVQPEATAAVATAHGEEEPPKPKLKKRTIIRRIVRKKKVLPKKDEKFCECSSRKFKRFANRFKLLYCTLL